MAFRITNCYIFANRKSRLLPALHWLIRSTKNGLALHLTRSHLPLGFNHVVWSPNLFGACLPGEVTRLKFIRAHLPSSVLCPPPFAGPILTANRMGNNSATKQQTYLSHPSQHHYRRRGQRPGRSRSVTIPRRTLHSGGIRQCTRVRPAKSRRAVHTCRPLIKLHPADPWCR